MSNLKKVIIVLLICLLKYLFWLITQTIQFLFSYAVCTPLSVGLDRYLDEQQWLCVGFFLDQAIPDLREILFPLSPSQSHSLIFPYSFPSIFIAVFHLQLIDQIYPPQPPLCNHMKNKLRKQTANGHRMIKLIYVILLIGNISRFPWLTHDVIKLFTS